MSDPLDFRIGCVCAFQIEFTALRCMLDKELPQIESVAKDDDNKYAVGQIGEHFVVIAMSNTETLGTPSTTRVTTNMAHTFPHIELCLSVGIGSGAPTKRHDIKLGDVVVGHTGSAHCGVLLCELGATMGASRVKKSELLHPPPPAVTETIVNLRLVHSFNRNRIHRMTTRTLELEPSARKACEQPPRRSDRLYKSTTLHPFGVQGNCETLCGDDHENTSRRIDEDPWFKHPAIHYGLIASSSNVLSDAVLRDQFAHQYDVLCFEMQGVESIVNFPNLVIRGICDYADTHRNTEWQGYAALTAAVYASEFLVAYSIFKGKYYAASDDSDTARRLHRLANWSESRFQQSGQLMDLDYAIDLARQAVDFLPLGSYRVFYQNSLADKLTSRFTQLHQEADLDEAIDVAREALSRLPFYSSSRALHLSRLSKRRNFRFERSQRIADLDNAIDLDRKVVDHTAKSNHGESSLEKLANKLSWRFIVSKRLVDLEEAIDLARRAGDSTPQKEVHESSDRNHLAHKLQSRYDQLTFLANENEAKNITQKASQSISNNISKEASIAMFPTLKDFDSDTKVKWATELAIAMYSTIIFPMSKIHVTSELHRSIKDSLIAFSYSMQYDGNSQSEAIAAKFVREEASEIARKFLGEFGRAQSMPDSVAESHQDEEYESTSSMETKSLTGSLEQISIVGNPDGNRDAGTTEFSSQTTALARSSLTRSRHFKILLSRMAACLSFTCGHHMRSVSETILHRVLHYTNEVTRTVQRLGTEFRVEWDLISFLSEEYTSVPDFAKIITLIKDSDPECVQAITVLEYMTQVWPTTGRLFLQAVKKIIALNAQSVDYTTRFEWPELDVNLSLHFSQPILHVFVRGPLLYHLEIGEQLAWLGSTCRTGLLRFQMSSIAPSIKVLNGISVPSTTVAFNLSYELQDPGVNMYRNSRCWEELFLSPCIADGFPVRVRSEDEKGLEIPLEIMVALSGVDRATYYTGQLLLKGFETLIVPVLQTAGSIIWHLCTVLSNRRISYNAYLRDSIIAARSVDVTSLSTSRHFLGWVPEASQHAGTRDGKYDGLHTINLPPPASNLKFDRITIGASHFFSLTAAFTVGKSGKGIRTSDAGLTYREKVHALTKTRVVLYDDDDRRGWLIDAASAVLHLLRFHVDLYPPVKEDPIFDVDSFPYAQNSMGPTSASEILRADATRGIVLQEDWVQEDDVLEETLEGTIVTTQKLIQKRRRIVRTIEDKVCQFWDYLEQMQDQLARCHDEVSLGKLNSQDIIEGWSFGDLIQTERRIRSGYSKIDNGANEWLRLIHKIDAIVLLGSRFGEVIKPAPKTCADWTHVPPKQGYLAAPLILLKRIYMDFGSQSDSVLAGDVNWCIIAHPFKCDCVREKVPTRRQCNPVQSLSQKILTTAGPKPTMKAFCTSQDFKDGAVIFGKRRLRKAGGRGVTKPAFTLQR